MKVGLFSYAFPYPNAGYNPGIETLIYDLAEKLSKKIEVTVYTSFVNGGKEIDELEGIRILRAKEYIPLSAGNLNSLTHALSLVKKYRNEIKKEDILHDIGSMIPFWFSEFSAPSITTFHHHEELFSFKDYLSAFLVPFLFKKEPKADIVVAVSQFAKKELIDKYCIKPESVRVIPDGVDIKIFNTSVEPKFNRENTLFYLGSLARRKGLIYLIKALPIISEEINDVRLLVGGEGPQRSKLVEMVNRLGVQENVHFLGFLPKKEIPKYYRAATAFVFPTLKEGFGMVALESMACGTPVIASDIEPLKSIIGDAGLFFEPRNHKDLARNVIEILENRELGIKLSKGGVKRASEYSWDKVTSRYLDLYRNLLEEKRI